MTQHRYLVPAATKTRSSQIEKKGNNSFTHCYRHRMEEFQIINTDFRHTRSSLREVSPTHSPALSTISPCFTLLPRTYHRLTSYMFYRCKQTFLPLSISLSHMSEWMTQKTVFSWKWSFWPSFPTCLLGTWVNWLAVMSHLFNSKIRGKTRQIAQGHGPAWRFKTLRDPWSALGSAFMYWVNIPDTELTQRTETGWEMNSLYTIASCPFSTLQHFQSDFLHEVRQIKTWLCAMWPSEHTVWLQPRSLSFMGLCFLISNVGAAGRTALANICKMFRTVPGTCDIWCVCVCARALSHVLLFATPWTITHQAPPWDFLGGSSGGGCHFLLQRIFPTHGLNTHLLRCRRIPYCWTSAEALLKYDRH